MAETEEKAPARMNNAPTIERVPLTSRRGVWLLMLDILYNNGMAVVWGVSAFFVFIIPVVTILDDNAPSLQLGGFLFLIWAFIMIVSTLEREGALFAIAPVSRRQRVLAFWLLITCPTVLAVLAATAFWLSVGRPTPQILKFLCDALLGTGVATACYAMVVLPSLRRFKTCAVGLLLCVLLFFLLLIVAGMLAGILMTGERGTVAPRLLIVAGLAAGAYCLRKMSRNVRRRRLKRFANYPPIDYVIFAVPVAVALAIFHIGDAAEQLFGIPLLTGFFLASMTLNRKYLVVAPLLPATRLTLLLNFLIPGIGLFLVMLLYIAIATYPDAEGFLCLTLLAAGICASSASVAALSSSDSHKDTLLMGPLALVFMWLAMTAQKNPDNVAVLYSIMAALASALLCVAILAIWLKLEKRRLYA